MAHLYEKEHTVTDGDVTIRYTSYNKREERREECHGYHYFYDDYVVDVRIDAVILCINEFEIDITDRLTSKEKSEIAETYYL